MTHPPTGPSSPTPPSGPPMLNHPDPMPMPAPGPDPAVEAYIRQDGWTSPWFHFRDGRWGTTPFVPKADGPSQPWPTPTPNPVPVPWRPRQGAR